MHTTSAIAYCRVSTTEQAAEGISLDAQRDAVESYARLRGLDLVDIVVDAGVSAGKPLATRDGGSRVLEIVGRRGGVKVVIAYKLDRLFRSATDCLSVTAAWDRAGVALHLIDLGGASLDTSSPMGRFFLTVLAGASEMERALIAERTSSALQFKKSRGEYVGGQPPFGYRVGVDGRSLEPVTEEQVVLEKIASLRAGGSSIRAISARLNADGDPARGGRWHPTTVANLLRRLRSEVTTDTMTA